MTIDRPRIRSTWPVHRCQAVQLTAVWAVLTIVWISIGSVLTGPLSDGPIVHADVRVARWMVAQRTPSWNHFTVWGSLLAETATKVVVTAVLALLFLRWWRRWFEPLVLVVSLIIEAGVLVMIDDLAERIATLGGVPSGLPGRLTAARTWDDYSLDRADALTHLGALDLVYTGVIEAHRAAMDQVSDDDSVSEDLLIGQTGELERYHWFVRSHLEDWAGGMANAGTRTELGAAAAVAAKARKPVARTTRTAS